MPPFRVGQTVNLFELAARLPLEGSNEFVIEAIFEGGMGDCLKIHDKPSNHKYALKVMNGRGLLRREAYLRFLEEVKIWFTVSACEGVVQALAVFSMNGIPCVCAEWMDGGSLQTLMADQNPSVFYATMDRVIGTLNWVYRNHRIVHRDLKPSNLLLNSERLVSISDWGIGKIQRSEDPISQAGDGSSSQPHDQTLTQTGQFVGTVLYSAPEQILGGRSLDFRADIYSLGCLMYEWETGQPPFLGRSAEEIMYQHLERPAPQLGGILKRTTFGAEAVVAKCLAKRPEDRYASYDELRRALQRCAGAGGVAIPSFKPVTRYRIPLVGAGQIRSKGLEKAETGRPIQVARQEDGVTGVVQYALVEHAEVEAYLREAGVLSAIGDDKGAAEVYSRAFVPEMFCSLPDYPLHQHVAVNYGLLLTRLGRAADALWVLDAISKAKSKPAEYFVNRSWALLRLGRYRGAEECAREGLQVFPNDPHMLGNMTEALTAQGDYEGALPVAQRRLAMSRDINALDEMAGVYSGQAYKLLDTNWPEAVVLLQKAIKLLIEAKHLNPQFLTARFNLAFAWFRLEDYTSASRELNELTELPLGKQWGELWAIRLAECLNRVAAFKECVEFCRKWLSELPDSISLQRVLAETIVDGYCIGYEREGVRIVDRSSYDFFAKMVKDETHCTASDFRYFARLRAWMGDVSIAFELLDKAEQLEPGHWEVPFNRAYFFAWYLQDLESAMYHARRGCKLGPWSSQPWKLISYIQRRSGLTKDADESQRRAEMLSKQRSESARARADF
jgi:tetratricopeptide (TPR) repeat protein